MKNLSESIKQNDLAAYQAARYPDIPDGEAVVFDHVDFSGTNFGQFAAGFFEFHDCKLDSASELYGQPIRIDGGTARGIDLRGVRAIIKAVNCNFIGLQYDDSTELAYGKSETDARSEFINCQIDVGAKKYFEQQGVIFRDKD